MAEVMRVFLEKEAKQGGWRFWLLFTVATNLGWFPGILLGLAFSDWLSPDNIGPVKALTSVREPAVRPHRRGERCPAARRTPA